jgi:hypothetical protein
LSECSGKYSISVREQRQKYSGTTQAIGTSAATNLLSSTAAAGEAVNQSSAASAMIAFKTLQINMVQNSKGKTSGNSYIMTMIILKISPLIISQILPALLVLIIRILIYSLEIKTLNRLLKLLNRLRCLRHRFTTAIKMSQ